MPSTMEAPDHSRRFFASAFYLLFFAAQASILPFLTIYYQQLGLSGSQIGLFAGIPPLISLISAPFWTGLADTSGRHKLVLSTGLLGVTGAILLLSRANSLSVLLLAIIGYAFFSATIIPLADSATLHMLGGEKARYGRIRLWGSIGWGLASPLTGKIIDSFGMKISFGYSAAVYAIVLLISLGLTHSLNRLAVPFWRGIRQVLADRRWLSFLGLSMVGGMSLSVVSSYLLLFMNSLGASKTLMGWVMTVSTLSEIPFLFFVDRLLKRWGARRVMAISIAAYALRALLVSLAKVPETMLLIQVLHGATFALFIGAGVTLADEMAPHGLNATGQGLFSSAMGGIGVATGAILGGWLYEGWGGAGTFRVMSGVAFAGLLVWLTLGKGLRES